jgi:hypothetical protein
MQLLASSYGRCFAEIAQNKISFFFLDGHE